MARLKRGISKEVQKAQKRRDGMKAIDPALDFGEGVSVATLEAGIKKVTDGIAAYNSLLAQADEMVNDINLDMKALSELHTRALAAAKFKFGADSNEYEMVGGTRTSERKKPSKNPTPVSS